jgi:hypothetical protein
MAGLAEGTGREPTEGPSSNPGRASNHYTAAAIAAVIGVVTLELRVLHTGLLWTRAYWIAMAISYAFMIAVNGWLTKLSAPIVLYDGGAATGLLWDAAAPTTTARTCSPG